MAKKVKVFDEKSPFFSAFSFLSENFPRKTVVPGDGMQSRSKEQDMQQLSRKLVRLLRWDLPHSGIPFSRHDGSALIEDVADCLRVSIDMVRCASASIDTKKKKMRTIVFELFSHGRKEIRVAALGGHGFPVYAPPGHCLITNLSPEDGTQVTPLVHETDKVSLIKQAGYLSSMDRNGGINFHPKVSGGYRPNANYEISIDDAQLVNAINDGLQFFHNHFSGIVFGVGQWNQ